MTILCVFFLGWGGGGGGERLTLQQLLMANLADLASERMVIQKQIVSVSEPIAQNTLFISLPILDVITDRTLFTKSVPSVIT